MPGFDVAALSVALRVRDLARVRRFYEEAIGLVAIEADAGVAHLGAGGRAFLELRADPDAAPRAARDAGLFHTAFLLPSRADLGRWLAHAGRLGVPLEGASDHVVSEALYLSDPEGNGIEVYADRPRAAWTWADGLVAMRTDPLDRDGLVRAGGGAAWAGAPAGTGVGHVHLQVGAIPAAEAFLGDVLGLALTARYPGGSFFASGGYHHHLAANVWRSCGAPVRTEPSLGLAEVVVRVAEAAQLDALARRATAAGLDPVREAGAVRLRDPWGTRFTLTA